MTIGYGVGMLAIGILGILVGAVVAFFIINKVMEDKDKWWYILTPLQRQDTLSYYDGKIHTTDWHIY